MRFYLVLAILSLTASASAGTLYVDRNLTTGLDDGSSWANAFQGGFGLNDALAVAAPGDQIFVAEGVYTAANALGHVLANDVAVYGGFLGGESAPGDRPPFGTAPTTLRANPGSPTMTTPAVRAEGTGPQTLLDGFTIRSVTGGRSSGILCDQGAQVLVQDCVFEENRGVEGAAANILAGSSARFVDCTFQNNSTFGNSSTGFLVGAAFFQGSSGLFERCVFRGNQGGASGTIGAVMSGFSSNVAVQNCLVYDNVGVAAYSFAGSTLTLSNTTVVRNNASGPAAGLFAFTGSSANAENSILWNNIGSEGTVTENQVSGATATYCIVEGGLAGTGNLSATPVFVDLAGRDLALLPTSPGVDAGNNSAVRPGTTLDAAGNPRFADVFNVPDTGVGAQPIVDMGAFEVQALSIPTFCNAADGALASCPCANPGGPDSGCDIQQATGGVELTVVAQETLPANRATLQGAGFPFASSPTSIVTRSPGLEPGPVVFGDGLRCVGTPLVRLAATFAATGQVRHTFGHGTMAGGGDRHYQLWFRNTPAAFCTPDAFNLSNGVTLTW